MFKKLILAALSCFAVAGVMLSSCNGTTKEDGEDKTSDSFGEEPRDSVVLLTAVAEGGAEDSSDYDNRVVGMEESMRRNRKYLLDLFYGMEKDSTGNYLDDPVLSAIPGLIHKEYAATWCIPSDSVRFEMTMGIYADKSYPSDAVRNVLFRKLNTVISEGLSYDSDEKQMSLLKRGVKCNQSTDSYLRGWQNLFNKVTAMNGYNSSFSDYPVIVGSRVCVVCHKIYEDSKQATYIVEKSIDNHSSTGCPAYADYYTIDKRTGSILCLSEFLSRHKSDDIEALILKEYRMAAEAAGFRASGITGEELIRNANGVAMLGEGTLIYFHPYTIGCGAEGQYNIIIPVR